MRKGNLIWLLLVFSLLFSAGCASTTEVSQDIQPDAGVGEAIEESMAIADTIVIGVGRNLYYGHSDWHMIHGSLGVWEPLVYPDENLKPQPVLAAGWESNDDATEWTIQLREDVVFHDGTAFNADIAAANLLAAHENYTPIATLDRIEVVDDLTLKIFLSESTPALMALLANYSSAQFSPATFEQGDAEMPVPFGSGPYKFESFTDGEQIVLVRNEDYWGEPAKTERIIYRFIPDANTRIMALQSGEIDAIIDVGALIPSQGQVIEQTDGLVLATQDVVTTHYLFFNNDKAPLDNVVLRQAISMAIDRELITREAVYGYGFPAVSNITPLSTEWVNPDAEPVHDLEQAKALAESVLGEERISLSLLVNSGLANRWPYAEMAQIIQAELAEIGIDLDIEMVEGGTWNEKLANDEYDISMRPFTLSSGDPDDFMSYWARENGKFNTKYSISYSDSQVESLIAEAISEVDYTQRQALYAQLQMIFAEQVPFTPIFHEQSLFAFNESVLDLTMDASFKPALEKVYKIVP